MTDRPLPLPLGEWPPEMRQAIAALRPEHPRHPFPPRRDDRPKGLNVLGMLAHHPQLATAYHSFCGHALYGTTLTQRQREIIVLRVATVRSSEYEWAQHAVIAADVGLDRDDVARVAAGPDADGWDPLDRALVAAVDELVADARIGDDTWAVLSRSLDTQQIMDVVFTVGSYEVLAMALRTFDVQLDDDLKS
jgi:alkylhydroperoxidase family enzyme